MLQKIKKGIILIVVGMFVCVSQAHAVEFTVKGDVYAKTVEEWAYAVVLHELGGDTLIDIIPGNGVVDSKHKNKKRATIIYVSKNYNPTKPAELIMFFHGLNGFKNFERREAKAAKYMEDHQDRNFILVIPELPWSHHTSTPRERQGYAWRGTQHENIKIFYQEVVSRIHVDFGIHTFWVGKLTLVGHSAGGSALMRAARSGGLDALEPHTIIFSDAGYGTWTDVTWRYYGNNHQQTEFVLLVRSGDTPHKNTMRFLKPFGKRRPENITLKVFSRKHYTHTRIGNECLMWQ